MRVAEIFRSLQGEGFLTGTDAVFVRASGCNLRCWFCDTPYASWLPEGENLTVDEIVHRAIALADVPPAATHVVLTGGEPMLFAELAPLTRQLRNLGWHITVETAGTLYLAVECDLMSISPKLSNSTPQRNRDPRWSERHERTRHVPGVIRRLIAEYPYQIKFVVDRPEDCLEVEGYLAGFPEIDRAKVLLMPQGTNLAMLAEKEAWLRPYCDEHGVHFCARRQIEWFGLTRGT